MAMSDKPGRPVVPATSIGRRRFLRGAAATAGVFAFADVGRVQSAFARTTALPPPEASGIEHIIVVMMENRSFDHFLGWFPHADGRQRGPTIWDRLDDAGLEGRYYYSDVPFLALWGLRYLPIARPVASFLADAAAGTLPDVAFVDPRFLGEGNGTSNDDHPFADIRSGEAFLNQVYSAVTRSPAWPHTLLVINYDEWGGFFDHVPPTLAPIPEADRKAGDEDGRRGFRTPCLVLSPLAPADVSSLELDHTSVLRTIEWRWGLAPLTVRDQTANNLAEILDFAKPDLKAKQFRVPTGPFGAPCATALRAAAGDKWEQLRQMAADSGWPV